MDSPISFVNLCFPYLLVLLKPNMKLTEEFRQIYAFFLANFEKKWANLILH